MQNYHLTREGFRWKLCVQGKEKIMAAFETREEAVKVCGKLLRNRQGNLRILKADGTVEEELAYPLRAMPSAAVEPAMQLAS